MIGICGTPSGECKNQEIPLLRCMRQLPTHN